MSPTPKLLRTFFALAAATLLVFAALLGMLALKLRQQLRRDVQTREAAAIHAVAQMEISTAQERLQKLGVPFVTADLFAAALESSRLGGVLALQLFDATGTLRQALPPSSAESTVAPGWWEQPLAAPVARYHPAGSLADALGATGPDKRDASHTPLLEVAVPLGSAGEPVVGVARYWLDGSGVAAEFRRIDRSLAGQAGAAFAGGAALVALLLTWAYRRLAAAQRRLLEQSADLTRANEELDFAAKTGALGAISAHLIHGLKNPLAGLEGFVAEAGAERGANGQNQQTAMETARRLRTMVNDVVSVLRDEASGGADYAVPLSEVVQGIELRSSPSASAAGITLRASVTGTAHLPARVANLASLVVANLLANAIEASRTPSDVLLEARAGEGTVDFVVTDAAGGLPANVRDALFRPVRSTKAGGGGMGLAISHRLARHAGGDLRLIRSDATGTVFKLTVPSS